MWKEILTTDTTGIQDFVRVQALCSEYYATKWDVAKITAKFSKGSFYGLRAFTYRDTGYEINLAVCNSYFLHVADTKTMVLNTVGIGKYKTIGGAIKIISDLIPLT